MKQNISKSADCRAGQHNGYMATSDTWKQCSIFTPTELGGDEVVDALKRRRTVAGEAQRGLEVQQLQELSFEELRPTTRLHHVQPHRSIPPTES
eukprot:68826-Amphidinium_carterae.1